MAIDEPISALESLNASDERQRSPATRYAKQFLDIVQLFAPPGTSFTLSGMKAAMGWLDQKEEKNREELVNAIAEEVKRHSGEIQRLLARDEQHRRFMEEDMPGLVADALRRAEQCRASERIKRLSRVLTNAVTLGPRDGADAIEEMMTLATALSERDVAILQIATEEYNRERARHAQEQQTAVASRAWAHALSSPAITVSQDEQVSVGAKLESFGLVIRLEREAWESPAFRPLERANKFIEYIRTVAN